MNIGKVGQPKQSHRQSTPYKQLLAEPAQLKVVAMYVTYQAFQKSDSTSSYYDQLFDH